MVPEALGHAEPYRQGRRYLNDFTIDKGGPGILVARDQAWPNVRRLAEVQTPIRIPIKLLSGSATQI